MTDPRHAHEFLPNRRERCKRIVGTEICALPKSAAVHLRWRRPPLEETVPRCPICGEELECCYCDGIEDPH